MSGQPFECYLSCERDSYVIKVPDLPDIYWDNIHDYAEDGHCYFGVAAEKIVIRIKKNASPLRVQIKTTLNRV